jgi:Zn-dependent membrane protease YugP
MKLRSAIVPAANLGSQAGPLIIILGLVLMGFSRGTGSDGVLNLGFDIALLGLALFACILVFHVVTFPVEVDASRRAMGLLRQSGVLTHEDVAGARSVLTAAALTYFAAIAASAIQVAYWAMQVFGRRD